MQPMAPAPRNHRPAQHRIPHPGETTCIGILQSLLRIEALSAFSLAPYETTGNPHLGNSQEQKLITDSCRGLHTIGKTLHS